MAIEPNNTGLEFETMLRRHLKNSGGPAEACIGFDVDAASAYLEGALGAASQARYEAHLSGCPTCRRQIIELSRLSLTMDASVAATIAPVADKRWSPATRAAAVIAKLKKQLDFSNWHWDWRIAGTAAAACTILAVGLAVQTWRRAQQPEQLVAATKSQPAAEFQGQEKLSGAPNSAPVPEPTAPATVGVMDQSVSIRRQDRPVPMPPQQIGPATIPPAAAGAQESFAALSQEVRGRQALATQLPSSSEPAKTVVADLAAAPSGVSGPLRSSAQERAESQQINLITEPSMAPRIAPSSDDNPMRSIALRERRSDARTRSEKISPQDARPGWYDRVMGFMPAREADKQTVKPPVQDDETVNPLTRKFRDKSFRFDRGMWVDQSYKPEVMAWRVVRLTRNSKEYERLLEAEPQLKEFLSLGPMIIVWRDKVYRISGQ